jgi:catechol 2,3-dioxygenase-like lactoylglutathione lyase family enzyme
MIQLNFIDHVAIRVADMERSARWYESVLGLKRYTFDEWGPFPIFMLSGKCGVAIFPAGAALPVIKKARHGFKIDHFAFNVDRENFQKAKKHYEELNLEFHLQDHVFFHSLYTRDPDGHTVELTTLVVDETKFYQ